MVEVLISSRCRDHVRDEGKLSSCLFWRRGRTFNQWHNVHVGDEGKVSRYFVFEERKDFEPTGTVSALRTARVVRQKYFVFVVVVVVFLQG